MPDKINTEPGLKRRLNLALLTLYGIGNILGAGIYVLIGKIAGNAGMFAPVSFFISFFVAAFMAFVYSEISSRFPESSGEAKYVHEGFHLKWLTVLVGYFIVISGIVSSAAMFRGVVGYVRIFIEMPDSAIILLIVLCFGIIANIGVKEAVGTAAVFTLIEAAGIIFILISGFSSLYVLPERYNELIPGNVSELPGILTGAFLAFYAFIGFEDMVNMAEEVKDPEKNLPRGILISIFFTAGFYILISVISVLSVKPDILSASKAPLALVYESSTGNNPLFISAVSIFAILNGGLIQMIMASRILYGMSRRGWAPKFISYVHDRTGSPVVSSIFVIILILLFALVLPVESLAGITSFFLLLVFSLVSLSLILIKTSESKAGAEGVRFPVWIAIVSFLLTSLLILSEVFSRLGLFP